jgi:hypothetical protein
VYEGLRPDEAERALNEIDQRQEQVIRLAIIPSWFWWAVAVLMVVLSASVDSRRPWAIGVGVTVFVLGILAVTASVVLRGARQAQLHNDLVRPTFVFAILGFVALVLAVSLPTAFALRAAGVGYPGTWGVALGAVVMVIGGPILMRLLQRMMLANRAGSRS